MTDAPQNDPYAKDEQGYFANLIWAPPGRGRAVKMPDSHWLLDGAGVRRGPIATWLPDPPDRTGVEIEILPTNFDTKRSGCALCGGTLDFERLIAAKSN